MKEFINILGRKFPSRVPSNCFSTNNDADILLEDKEIVGKTIFVREAVSVEYKEQNCFQVINPSQKEIGLWAIDGCFVGNGKALSATYLKKCDAAFGHEKCICFIEFKLNANPLANIKTIRENREKAYEQIESMICFLRDELGQTDTLAFEGYTIEAYICTPPTYPHKNTAITDLAINFLETYQIELFEQNTKIIP